MYGADCYTKEHTKISDKDFAHCDKIVVISEKEQKDFMIENYKQYSDKMEFWHIKEVKGDSKVKKKIARKIKEMVKKLYTELTKK
jgi:protein-tyrosine-phosphatase